MKRNCSKCKELFEESDLQESHDVPCYMFPGKDRKEKKQHADKHGRRYLCKKCHDIYEKKLCAVIFNSLSTKHKENIINLIKKYARGYF